MCGNAPICTSAIPMNAACTTASSRLSTTPSTKPLAGYCSQIHVSIHAEGSISVEDNGARHPVDIHPKYNMPALELVMTNLHAGGKFGKGAYQVSGGLHGVGAKCVNAVFRVV